MFTGRVRDGLFLGYAQTNDPVVTALTEADVMDVERRPVGQVLFHCKVQERLAACYCGGGLKRRCSITNNHTRRGRVETLREFPVARIDKVG